MRKTLELKSNAPFALNILALRHHLRIDTHTLNTLTGSGYKGFQFMCLMFDAFERIATLPDLQMDMD